MDRLSDGRLVDRRVGTKDEFLDDVSSQSEQLKTRTMAFGLMVLRLIDKMPSTNAGVVLARQLAKSATSVGANYRACCNARSRAEFIAKLGVVVEEIDESVYWIDLVGRSQLRPMPEVTPVLTEAGELRAIFAKSLGTARNNFKMNKSK